MQTAGSLITSRDDGLERAALVRHVTLGRFDQIRNQVVAPLQLHFDLRERVLITVLERDELVVDSRAPHHGNERDTRENGKHN